MKKYIQALVVVPALLLVLVVPQNADAQVTYQYQYQNQNQVISNQQQIAHLYSLIAQLQVLLNALQRSGVTAPTAASQTNNIAVATDGVSSEGDDAVELDGRVTFKRDGDARVWFEYGVNTTLSYSTISKQLEGDEDDVKHFSLVAPDLDDNRLYYYRAVAEDEDGDFAEGVMKSFRFEGDDNDNDDEDDEDNDEDTPDVSTEEVNDVDSDSAELNGDVDMNDFENGRVFFVFGEDEDMVEDVEDEDTYSDIDTDGDDLRKVLVSSSFDNDGSFTANVSGLTDDTEHFFRICVEYEDEDEDDVLVCGDVESFETDRD